MSQIKINKIKGLTEFIQTAKNIKAKLHVGFLSEDIAHIARINEFGAVMTVTPAMRKFFIANWIENGKDPEKKFFPKIGSTINIPARPFFRTAIEKNKKNWGKQLASIVQKQLSAQAERKIDNKLVQNVLDVMGFVIEGQIQESISNGEWERNAPFTIAKKGKDTPLIDTGRMLKSVGHKVE